MEVDDFPVGDDLWKLLESDDINGEIEDIELLEPYKLDPVSPSEEHDIQEKPIENLTFPTIRHLLYHRAYIPSGRKWNDEQDLKEYRLYEEVSDRAYQTYVEFIQGLYNQPSIYDLLRDESLALSVANEDGSFSISSMGWKVKFSSAMDYNHRWIIGTCIDKQKRERPLEYVVGEIEEDIDLFGVYQASIGLLHRSDPDTERKIFSQHFLWWI